MVEGVAGFSLGGPREQAEIRLQHSFDHGGLTIWSACYEKGSPIQNHQP